MKRILLLFLCISITGKVAAQKKLTLQEAISVALQKNVTLTKMKNNFLNAEAQLKGAYGDLLPNLGVSGSWSWSRTIDKGVETRDFLGNVISTAEQTIENRYYSLRAGGSVTLFDGLANYANISQKKDNLKSAEYDLSKIKQNIVYTTTDYYYIVLNAEELMRVRDENVQYYKKLYETIQERNKLGSVTLADVYTAQVQLGNAELSYIQTQNQFESVKANLLNYLALNVLDDYSLVNPFSSDKSINTESYLNNFADMQTMVNTALDTRFDYKSQKLILNAAENGIKIAQGGLFPSLSGDYGFSTSAINPNSLFNRSTYSLGLTLSLPIFSNFRIENQIQAAKINAMNVQEDLFALERQIKIEIKQTYLDLVAAKKSLDVAVKNVSAAEETRKINQERYNLGSATLLDVLQASRDYTDAMRNKINAIYEFYRQYDKLNNAIGRLDFSKYE